MPLTRPATLRREDVAQRPAPGGAALLHPRAEARVFQGLRRRVVGRILRHWASEARLRLVLLSVLTIVFWFALFASFAEGFWLLNSAISHEITRIKTIQAVFNVFFLALLLMLTISSAVVFYSLAFRSEDMRFLMTSPASSPRIAIHKLQEAAFFSCWGFVLLGSPMLLAYGISARSPWYYYLMLPPFVISFVVIASAVGAIACILLVRFLPRLRINPLFLAAAAVVVLFAVSIALVLSVTTSEDMLTRPWLNRTLARLELAQQRLLPSWWLSSGLLEAAHASGDRQASAWRESVLFLSVLVSNAMAFMLCVTWTARWQYRNAFSRMQGGGSATPIVQQAAIDKVAQWLLSPFSLRTRLLILKDLRLCRRDPLQWSQFLVFLGLLAFYFINIPNVHYGEALARWMNVIGFLNVGVVALILSTFTTRFIFPMISLEGRRFWILGTLPLDRDTILWSKLWFACGGAIVPCSLLILLSDLMLGVISMEPLIALVHQVACWVLCVGLSALAVGLGGRPARPASRVSIQDRRRIRRHAEPGAQRAVYHAGRARKRRALLLLAGSA